MLAGMDRGKLFQTAGFDVTGSISERMFDPAVVDCSR